ncbi:hypothetical protein Tco_0610614 [Tanacetum coccineum]
MMTSRICDCNFLGEKGHDECSNSDGLILSSAKASAIIFEPFQDVANHTIESTISSTQRCCLMSLFLIKDMLKTFMISEHSTLCAIQICPPNLRALLIQSCVYDSLHEA